ncbi:hypothetical protein BpHYR1_052441 [Brachionus plicatilis]|uniref:Uncharacterized protein n=1 Tax=Brachionus plicatilis TaxID=10195 RepID=A0A3M7QYB1_BRAPC|nr:hypothetical protein BpHYR1_052441 [Brachionus plicatilis]
MCYGQKHNFCGQAFQSTQTYFDIFIRLFYIGRNLVDISHMFLTCLCESNKIPGASKVTAYLVTYFRLKSRVAQLAAKYPPNENPTCIKMTEFILEPSSSSTLFS